MKLMNMTKNYQNGSLKQLYNALLRLTLPIVWVLLFICLVFTLVFLGLPCVIAAFFSWVICGNAHPDYTIVWCIFPIFVLDLYCSWLEDNDVIK